MRLLVQRVRSSSVSVDGKLISSINQGLNIFVGVCDKDTTDDADLLAAKVAKMRIFSDTEGKMNLSVQDIGGEALVISQFTLYADTRKGNRPSFIEAGCPLHAEKMYKHFINTLKSLGVPTQSGIFGADMLVKIENDGPVTIWIDSEMKTPKSNLTFGDKIFDTSLILK